MKLKSNQSGIAHVAAIVLVVVIVVIGFVGWKVWDNQKQDDTTNNQTNSKESSNRPTKTSVKQLIISQWGVQFDVPSNVQDLKIDQVEDYPASESSVASSTARLDSPALEASGKIKTTGTQERHEKLGYIQRQKSGTDYYPGTSIEEYAKQNNYAGVKIGDYYYVYMTITAAENSEAYLSTIKSSIESTLKSTN